MYMTSINTTVSAKANYAIVSQGQGPGPRLKHIGLVVIVTEFL